MAPFSIIYFVLTTGCLGFVIDLFVREWRADFAEKFFIRMGVGLALFSFLGVIFNLAAIPLDWRVFPAAGVAAVAGALVKNRGFSGLMGSPGLRWDLKKALHLLIVLLLFAVTAKMYIGGAFQYAWFEDGDPWGYAVSSKYIAEKKTFSAGTRFNYYALPYTQGYQIVMGVLHQTNHSIYWNMKFFNALVISFGVVFFYFFVRRFTSDEELALAAAFFLFAVPAWVSHFVFSLAYNMTIFLVALYVFAMIVRDEEKTWKGWSVIGAMVIGSLWVNHFYTAFMGTTLLFVYCLHRVIIEREPKPRLFPALMTGMLSSLLFYVPAYLPHWDSLSRLHGLGGADMVVRWIHDVWNFKGLATVMPVLLAGVALYVFRRFWAPRVRHILGKPFSIPVIYLAAFLVFLAVLAIPDHIFSFKGTGTKDYGLGDFFVARSKNMINNPVGIGLAVMSLFSIGIVLSLAKFRETFKPENLWLSTSLLWSVLSIFIILGTYFSITVAPFRMWTFFGLFASLLAAYGFISIRRKIPYERGKIAAWAVLAAVVIPTSFVQKYQVNNSIWPDHMVRVPESRALYERMRNGAVPRDSSVLRLCGDSTFLVGYDMSLDPILDSRSKKYYRRALDEPARDNREFLRRKKVEYVTLGLSCAAERRLSGNALQDYVLKLERKKNELDRHIGFSKIEETRTEVLFRVR